MHAIPNLIPPASDRSAWSRAALAFPERAAWLAAEARRLAASLPPPLTLGAYLDFFESGSRARFEAPYYERRQQLAVLVLAECLEGHGTHLRAIADRVWQIAEEMSWCIPAALDASHDQPPATPGRRRKIPGAHPDPFPDLFACETAAVLAETHHLLGPQLAGVSDSIFPAMRIAARRHVIDSFLARPPARLPWWAGWNNWAPWCASSILLATPAFTEPGAERDVVAAKALAAIVNYLDGQPEDGYCEEGASYAFVVLRSLAYAGAALDAMGLAHPLWTSRKVAAMAKAWEAIHLAGQHVANFGDTGPRHSFQPGAIHFLGVRLGEPSLQSRARLQAAAAPPETPRANCGDLLHVARDLFWMPTTRAPAEPHDILPPPVTHFAESEVAVLRSGCGNAHGMVCAVKGGHNAASHNHNDIGHVILLCNGRTLWCDLGPETYRADSWGPKRYSYWTLRGSAHNAPLINGHEQVHGPNHAADGWHFSDSAKGIQIQMELAAIYPEVAGVASARRRLWMRSGAEPVLTLTDDIESQGSGVQAAWIFYSPERPMLVGNVRVEWEEVGASMQVEAPGAVLKVEEVRIADTTLRSFWGDGVWRIRLDAAADEQRLSARIEVRTKAP